MKKFLKKLNRNQNFLENAVKAGIVKVQKIS